MVPLVRYRKVTLVVQNILSMISTVPYGNVMYRTVRIYLVNKNGQCIWYGVVIRSKAVHSRRSEITIQKQ